MSLDELRETDVEKALNEYLISFQDGILNVPTYGEVVKWAHSLPVLAQHPEVKELLGELEYLKGALQVSMHKDSKIELVEGEEYILVHIRKFEVDEIDEILNKWRQAEGE